MIESYLAELEQRLPATRRRRFLREAREHLRDAAAACEREGLDPAEAEHRAVAEFGPVDAVARAFAAEAAVHATRRSGVVVAAALGLLIVPLYGIPENTLPPAPWAEKPTHLAVQQAFVVSLFLLAVAVAIVGSACAWTRYARAAAPMLAAACVGGSLTALLGVALAVQWRLAAPETPLFTLVALLVPFAAGPLGLAVAAAAWAVRRRPLLA